MADLLTSKSTNINAGDLKTLLLAQKSELVGELTRAMANQFNNTMMAVTSYAELEMKRLPPAQRRSLEHVLSNAARATALVHKLLGISRNRASSPQTLNLNPVLTGIKDLIEQLAGERLLVVYRLDASIPAVNVDPTEIEQLVLSLALNARDSMLQGGTLTVATEAVHLTADSVGETEQPGDYVMLSVDDTGAGGSTPRPGQQETDADLGSRINLSLVAVRGVVKNAGAIASFSREPGKGSSYKIYFPALHPEATTEQERTTPRRIAVARTILLVEDDDAVRAPTAELLKMEGFKVLQARTGEEAIHLVQQNKASLDVLITDIVMPKMSGHEVAEKLLDLHPGLKILFISGVAESELSSQKAKPSRAASLRKPFRLDVLKDKIHELLGE
jgi:two-component system, cell cycle sensor histidine kinase and response regulator CckA